MERKLSFRAALRLWRLAQPLPWYHPGEGWLWWLLFDRRVFDMMDPVMEGEVNDGAALPECKPTVNIKRGFHA